MVFPGQTLEVDPHGILVVRPAPSRVTVNRWPAELKIRESLTARADPMGVACAFYGGAYTEVLRQYTGREYRILHPECEARDDSLCGLLDVLHGVLLSPATGLRGR